VPVKLGYKKASPRRLIKDVLHTGFEIKPAETQNYYGFETDGNHIFLLGDFTVTHNSTTAGSVFGLLKLHGVNSELITEFAKDLTWENRAKTLDNQYYVWAKQYHRLWRIGKQADVIVTDAPLLHSLIYGETSYEFKKVVMQNHNEFNNRNYYLIRVKDYVEAGRSQTEIEAKSVDEAVFLMLRDNNIEFALAEGSYKGVNVIIAHILAELGIERKYYIYDSDNLAKV